MFSLNNLLILLLFECVCVAKDVEKIVFMYRVSYVNNNFRLSRL